MSIRGWKSIWICNAGRPILKSMSDFYVRDICTSDLCHFLKFSNRRPILKLDCFDSSINSHYGKLLHHGYCFQNPLDTFTKFYQGLSWPWSYGSWIYNYLCNQCLTPLELWVWTLFTVRCTRYNMDKVCQWLATCQWFSAVSSTHKKWLPWYN